ncbi:uncharacterized protein LOC122403517 [Colletes gigas]|uniref:uncharacterized protein LOC122403517 n=1 Tax=Colletes gigas TaxID=935657 RepID=UPI001C9B1525|nr:uncharacterized protein LOC122403517 [Colletes gigas]
MAASAQLKTLNRNRAIIKSNVTRLIGYLNTNVDVDIDDVQTRKAKLEECYQSFSKIQIEIEILAEEAQLELDHESERSQFDDQYFKCAKVINQRFRELKPTQTIAEPGNLTSQSGASSGSNITISQGNSLLPKIEIRPFDGNPIQWYSFHDTFQSLVHNDNNIPAVQKFYLLKNSLVGSVATIIDQLTASEENYHVAWDLLKQRCDRPRQIIQTHIKAILELPEITKESPSNIRSLKESALMHVNALKALKEPIDAWNSILTYIIVRKLDKNTRRTWERTLDNTQMPKFTELIDFLNKQERGDETETSNSMIGNQNHIRVQSFIGTERRNECYFCSGNHNIYSCENLLKLTPRERSNAAKNKRLCLNCLRNNHLTNKCIASTCKKCHRKHNTLLHFVDDHHSIRVDTGSKDNSNSSTSTDPVKQGYTVTYNSEVLLGTARIKILDKNNKEHECRVLLDGCSQCHFISDKLAKKLQLKEEKIDLPFAGLGQLTMRAEYRVKATIKSKINNFQSEVEFVALPKITSLLPSRRVHRKELPIPHNIKLADPEFDKPAEIDALIGTTLFYKLLNIGQIKLSGASDVMLQKTMLGWIVVGEVHKANNKAGSKSCYLIKSLDNQLTRFWEVEEVPHKKHCSLEETKCETLYVETTKRDHDGRYIVQLPFNDKRNNIGESYSIALKRFYSIERKLARDKVLQQYYSNFLKEYRDLGHMRDITQSDNKQEGYYIPHHAVIKEDSLSTKVRVVFDASAKSTTNISLNDALMVGPPIQGDLIFIIMRFRLHNVVLAADLQKMYRQVKVIDSDTSYQKILWRECENETIRVFKLNTVTQGTASAPFLASRTLHQLADDEGHKFPLAAISLKNDFYVDDLLSGANTIQEALELKRQVTQILRLGGFALHKWASNKSEVIARSNIDEAQSICLNTEARKLLGIHWDSIGDSITYSVKPFAAENHSTKRTILSQIAQLFDPLGLLGPVITLAKLIMQGLWKAKVEWDESLPQEMHTKWTEFKKELPLLSQFKVSRQVILANAHDIQLHGFCDASETAYGACVYLRSSNKENNTLVQLICAKSRVAPIKTMTIPRLELCAAQLLARLIDTVSRSLNLKYSKIQLWSDSTIVLHWIQTSPHCLKTFVANRVAEIQSLTNINNWFHIGTEDNPADYISRGQAPSEFINNTHWQHGPSWLVQSENNWKFKHLVTMIVPEQRIKTALVITGRVAKDNSVEQNTKNDTFDRFSSINALIHFVAFCHRAVSNRKSANKKIGKFTIEDLRNARTQIIRVVQQTHFLREIKHLQQGLQLNAKSKIICLNPFLDTDGIIRVGGRLTNAQITYSRKYPILLPPNNHITKLIIHNEHIKNWHAGVQATLNAVRNTFWPIDGKNITRHVIHKCVRCSKLNPKLPSYTMVDLPTPRVIQSRPFDNVGLDYCGPFSLKEKKFRNKNKIKSYVAVFVCFVTRAVHFELVTDLTTEACLEAIKRFCARRGKPKNVYSDNATNFIGAKNEILKVRAFFISNENNTKLSNYFQEEGINWHFIPPRSPHFGGLWEAAVKSFKHHLYRTVGETMFTYEQFITCIIEIEAILNSRPLTPLSCDPNDLTALTPAHFLIGGSLSSIPELDVQDVHTNRLSMWQRVQQVKQHFWKRWHKEYLNKLCTKSKWHQGDGKQIEIGQLVMIKEDNLPPMQWSMGRIVQVHPGTDNIVRVATVKTQTGLYKRCVKKLAPLPIERPLET